jgi:uncharacterized protein (DUF58 family)
MVAQAQHQPENDAAAPRARVARLRLAPTRTFILLAAGLLVGPALAELVHPGAQLVLAASALALIALAAVDAHLGTGRAGGVEAGTDRITRLNLGRAASVSVVVRSGCGRALRVRAGLEMPADLGLDPDEPLVDLPADGGGARLAWRAMPRRRGSFPWETLHLEARSPWDLWTVRWSLALTGELRVYPDLRSEGRQVSALFMRRSSVGARLQRMVGRGREFEKLREYLPGDGYDEIHWKATAKRGHPVTKVFQVERTQEVYAVIDASRLSGREAGAPLGGPDGLVPTLLERQINASLALALAAERQRDLFGLVAYADTPRKFLRARSGAAHFQACREAMVALQSEPVSPDLREVCTFLRARLTKRALLMFLVSLDDPALAEAFVDAVQLIARHHVVVVATPRPPDAAPLFEGAAPGDLDGAYARLGGHLRWQGLQDLGARLHRIGVHHALLDRDALAAGAISHYMALKQRQMI